MRRLHIVAFVYLVNTVFSYATFSTDAWTVTPPAPWVAKGGEVVLQLKPSSDSPSPLLLCTVIAPKGGAFTADPGTQDEQEYVLTPGSPDRLLVSADSSKGCAARIREVSTISDGPWKLAAQFDNKEWRNGTTSVIIIDLPIPMQIVTTTIGSSANLNCKGASSASPYYCRIYSNSHRLVSKECAVTINPIKLEHIGDWTCVMAYSGSMEELNHTIRLTIQAREHVEGRTSLEGESLVLQCELRSSISAVKWCRAEFPGGRMILLSPGLVLGRYSALSTSIKDKICGLEIQLPLDKHMDHGQWRLDIGFQKDDYTGCFFTLPDNKRVAPTRSRRAVEAENAVVQVGGSLTLQCSVPWPATYCYVRRPDGSLLPPSTNGATKSLLRVGVCSITATNVTSLQEGRWTCGLSSNDGTEDVLFYTDVEVFSQQLWAVQRNVEAISGDQVFLLCRSALRRPLLYCRVTTPQGHGHALQPNVTNYSRLSYWGAGLEAGECGVKIEHVSQEDVGTWTCATTFNSFSQEDYATIIVEKLKPTRAFTVGMSLGAVIVVTVLLGAATVGYRKRRTARLREQDRTPALSPSNSVDHSVNSAPDYPLYGVLNTSVYRAVGRVE